MAASSGEMGGGWSSAFSLDDAELRCRVGWYLVCEGSGEQAAGFFLVGAPLHEDDDHAGVLLCPGLPGGRR